MPPPVSYRISEEDYLDFTRLHFWRNLRGFFILVAVVVALAVIVALANRDPAIAVGSVGGGLIAAIIMPLLSRYLVLPWRASKAFREFSMMHEEMTLTVTDEGFTISQESGSVTAKWKNMVKWDESERILAIYPMGQIAYVIPKAEIGTDRVDAIRLRLKYSGLGEKGEARS